MSNDKESVRWLVMKMTRPHSYYQSWEMLHGGHCTTQEEAEKLEAEWHAKYPTKRTLIIKTLGAPYSACNNYPTLGQGGPP